MAESIAAWLEKHLPFDLDYLPPNSYLVGGTVRDIVLKRKRDYFDLDFVIPEKAVEVAKQLARNHQAGFVILDRERNIARVVFPQGTLDFAQQEGQTLEEDLYRRDFTINAIAYCLGKGQLCDPTGGLSDLKERVIRMISVKNISDDPLRLLRAYRQAAQLNFSIEKTTELTLKQLAPELTKVAAERVKSELNYLLTSPGGSYWLAVAWQHNILAGWLPNATAHQVALLGEIDQIAQLVYSKFKTNISGSVALAKLTLLLSWDCEEAELELTNLKASRSEIRVITSAIKHLNILKKNQQPLTLREQYFLFLEVQDAFVVLALLCLSFKLFQLEIMSLLEHYFNPEDPLAHPKPLVTGDDLIKHFNIKPSPLIGKLLTEIQIAYVEGKITTVEEAIVLVKQML